MDEPPHDERMRRLQRIAYGALESDAERAAALAELESLRREHAAMDAPAASVVGGARAGAGRRRVVDLAVC
ncbi:hypothetical protein [Agromyces bauzanensis]|uniref:Uncharacterized protein n=1 Tax=Agromyces bauzanensis TaxID=1308924 RepID=A0A917PTQ7_9MICO|nr:hypothetical protein [Agromyces bauzanensis]GGJ91162.1 hypothetical protein GCM10011372_32010 [Agromyces bauzanensis]